MQCVLGGQAGARLALGDIARVLLFDIDTCLRCLCGTCFVGYHSVSSLSTAGRNPGRQQQLFMSESEV